MKNEDFYKISQVSSEVDNKILVTKGLQVKIDKKFICNFIKELNNLIKLERCYLSKSSISQLVDERIFAKGKSRKNAFFEEINEDFVVMDLSFLKRVKSLGDQTNLILITSYDTYLYQLTQGLDLKKVVIEKMKLLEIYEENLIFYEEEIPVIQAKNKDVFQSISKIWPCNFKISSVEIVKHDKNEINDLFNFLQNESFDCLLYDPLSKKILEKSKFSENINPLNHPIIQLINLFSEKLLNENNDEKYPKLGLKRSSPTDSYFNLDEQYYCKDLYIFSINEPCLMCSMALSIYHYLSSSF